jgi:hypothetical protein
MLGSLATAPGLIGASAAIAGLTGVPLERWNQRSEVWTPEVPPRYASHWDPEIGGFVHSRVEVVATTTYLPSRYCFAVALLGAAFGGVGLAVSWDRRRVSALSAPGSLLCLLSCIVPLLYFFALSLIY